MNDIANRRLNPGYSPYTSQTFMTQLSAEECGVFQEKLFEFPGFHVQRRTIRQYMEPTSAHILGDIGEVSPRDIKKDPYYVQGDYIGKVGVEASYEEELRGRKGEEILLRDARGRLKGRYKGGKYDIPSTPGHNLTLGIDMRLQMLADRKSTRLNSSH